MSPKPLYIPIKRHGFGHPKCYLSHTNACSTKISAEHYISKNLLDKIERQNKTIDIMGLSWLSKQQLTSMSKRSLTSNVLCAQHNSDLAPLDSEVGDFVDAIGTIDKEFQEAAPRSLRYAIDGTFLERWILKTVIGLVKAGQIKQRSGEDFILKRKTLELLCSPSARWPLGWGLYVALPTENVHHSSSFELLPKSRPDTGQLLVLGLKFNGIEINFLMGKPENPKAFGILRPRKLVFQKDATKAEIAFKWHGRQSGPEVLLTRVGTYSGPAPGHDLPRRACA